MGWNEKGKDVSNDDQGLNLRMSQRAHVEITFSPSPTLVPIVRRFVDEFYSKILNDPEITSRLVVATHELVENAVKFSTDGQTTFSIHVAEERTGRSLVIRTRNRSNLENIAVLQQMFAEIAHSPNPSAYYQVLMRRSAKLKKGSGLGLGRVRAESEMEMSLKADGMMVELQARTALPTEKRR